MNERIKLRAIRKDDSQSIHEAFKKQDWNKPVAQFDEYFKYQKSGERDVIVADYDGEFAGYLTIKWKANYLPFQRKGIPEIVDFNVLKKYQRHGIGTCLMDEAEKRMKTNSKYAGIGFGVYKDYGAAQILYINRGYKPDGNGISKNSIPIEYGESITIDDSIVFCLMKEL